VPYAAALECRVPSFGEAIPPGMTNAAWKKMHLSVDEAAHTIIRLESQGWIRDLPQQLARFCASQAPKRGSSDESNRTRFICLGERSYAELKGYVDRRTEGRVCAACQRPCVLCVTCTTQSRASAAAASAAGGHRCQTRLHFQCAHHFFTVQLKNSCPAPDCGQVWDRYQRVADGRALKEEPKEERKEAAGETEMEVEGAAPARTSPAAPRRAETAESSTDSE
jgi:hypothetical protein